MSAEVENTHEKEQQPVQLTTVMKRPSLENDLTSRQEDSSPTEDLSLRTSFVLGSGRRQDRHVDIAGHASWQLSMILTLWSKGLMQPMKMKDVDRFSVVDIWEMDTISRVLFSLRCVDFRKYFVPYGYKSSQICPSSNGITLGFDEWKDLLEVIIPTINERFP